MQSLLQVKAFLEQEKQRVTHRFNYAIPDVWDLAKLTQPHQAVRDGNLLVHPYQHMIETINYYLDHAENPGIDYLKPYYKTHPLPNESLTNGDWIKQSVAYSMMIRTSSAYDHDRNGRLDTNNLYDLRDTGTFLKTLMLLPSLKKMGVDTLYLLPISKYSLKDKKGELGSPYGVSNFFELDPNLKDPLTGTSSTVDLEFKALVEAAHILGMKVVIDIIPRTNSVNSDLILDHPDWFYWIKKEDIQSYGPPQVKTIDGTVSAKKEYFEDLFQSEEVIEHLQKFVLNPRDQDPLKWNRLLLKHKENPNIEILDLVEDTFGLTVAPAFSDHINDPQPAWTDITYFRLFLDHPKNSQPYLDELDFEVHPYILYDVAKASLNPGGIVNKPLWEVLSDIIPYYQRQFGIDGARIDMGHALPEPLINLILSKAKRLDPNFCFIAEELDIANAQDSLDKGYNMIIGNGFVMEPYIREGRFNQFVYGAYNLPCPVFACGETHDTPRIAARFGGKVLAKMLTLFNYFIPNTVPFINSAQEFYERQPMNTGLDARPNEAFMLDKDDPYYGKLALFDRYMFHMLEDDRFELMNLMEQAMVYKRKYQSAILDRKRTYPIGFSGPWEKAASFAYENEDSVLVAVCNTNLVEDDPHWIQCFNLPERFLDRKTVTITEVFSSHSQEVTTYTYDDFNQLHIIFKPGEVKLLEITLNQA